MNHHHAAYVFLALALTAQRVTDVLREFGLYLSGGSFDE